MHEIKKTLIYENKAIGLEVHELQFSVQDIPEDKFKPEVKP
jgi:hypothetical protein